MAAGTQSLTLISAKLTCEHSELCEHRGGSSYLWLRKQGKASSEKIQQLNLDLKDVRDEAV